MLFQEGWGSSRNEAELEKMVSVLRISQARVRLSQVSPISPLVTPEPATVLTPVKCYY